MCWSIRLLVQYLAGPDVEPLSGLDCTANTVFVSLCHNAWNLLFYWGLQAFPEFSEGSGRRGGLRLRGCGRRSFTSIIMRFMFCLGQCENREVQCWKFIMLFYDLTFLEKLFMQAYKLLIFGQNLNKTHAGAHVAFSSLPRTERWIPRKMVD